MITHFFFVAMLLFASVIPEKNYVKQQLFGVMVGISLYLFRSIFKKDASLSLLWVATALSFVFGFAQPSSPFGRNAVFFENVIAQGFATFLIVSLFSFSLNRSAKLWLGLAFQVFAYVSSAILIWRAGFGDYNRDIFQPYGALNNGGLDATFLGCMLPLLPWPAVLLPIAAIIVSKSSTGLMCVGIFSLWKIVSRPQFWNTIREYFWLGIPLIGACYIGEKELFSGTGRFEIWGMVWDFMLNNRDQWFFGYGAGTFSLAGPLLQQKYQVMLNNGFTWVHNEYLQIFFEQGLVGILFVFIVLIKHVRSLPVILFCLCAIMQPVLRVPLLALFGAYLFLSQDHLLDGKRSFDRD